MNDDQEKIQIGKQKESEKNALWQLVTRDIIPIDRSDILPPHIKEGIHSLCCPKLEKGKDIENPVQYDFSKERFKSPRTLSRDIDANTQRRLKQGKIKIEARIDLHGMTQVQAYDALHRFIQKSYFSQLRCVLVITGKGGARSFLNTSAENMGKGVLRANVPMWLNDKSMDQFILKIHTAKPCDGGEGALYVLLRRMRED